jgi:hypothetical protein
MRAGRILGTVAAFAAASLLMTSARARADEPTVARPLEGALVGRTFTVAGTVPEDATGVFVDGKEVVLEEGAYAHEVNVAGDGPFVVVVVAARPGRPGMRVERRVVVDTRPPRLRVLEPAGPVGTFPAAEGRVRGIADDLHFQELRINGQAVSRGVAGLFETAFALPEEGDLEVVVVATDAAGNSTTEKRALRRGPAMTPPPRPPAVALPPPAAGIEAGLAWLATHQSPSGEWEAEGFGTWCNGAVSTKPAMLGAGRHTFDVGVTGLALLAFVGAGHTAASKDARGFGRAVAAGTSLLRSVQDAKGCFGLRETGHYIYNHAFATQALLEEFAANPTAEARVSAQRALDFLFAARNPGGGWRYGVRPGDSDLSVTTRCFLPIARARMVNEADVRAGRAPSFVLSADAVEGAAWMLERTLYADTGRGGYRTRGTGPARRDDQLAAFPAERSESMTALSIVLGRLLGKDSKDLGLQRSAAVCYAIPVKWEAGGWIDLYYWHAGALGLFGVGRDWSKWHHDLERTLLAAQRRDGDACAYRGSWDALDPWGADGGRVYTTAMAVLCLQDVRRSPYGWR